MCLLCDLLTDSWDLSLNLSVPKEEETVYDEVKVREEMAEQTDNTKGKNKTSYCFHRKYANILKK